VQAVGSSRGRARSVSTRPLSRPPGRAKAQKDAVRRRLLFAADLSCFFVAVAATTLVEGTTAPLWALAMLPLWVGLAKVEGLYDADHPRIWHSTTDEAWAIFHWVTLSVAGTLFFIRAIPPEITVESAGTLYAVALVCAFLFRPAARAIWRRAVPRERALVLGGGKLALEPAHHLYVIEQSGEQVESDGDEPSDRTLEQLSADDIHWLLCEAEVERVVLAIPELDEAILARVVAACRSAGVKLSVVPPMRAMLGTAVSLNHIAEMPVIEYGSWDAPASTIAIKRAIDLVVSAAGLVLLAPLMLIIALAVRIHSRGPALFRQVRAGRNGRPFMIIKFRTMCHDAEERISEVIRIDEMREPMYKLADDPRVTRIGRFLRRTSLDELPQLFNVLRGDMSLVGPRPEEMWLVERYGETERFRLQMRPGITGPMQVHGRAELSWQERLAVEREYVENYGLHKDLEILLRTVSATFRASGAY
jgi:exopolysaccharide biosynthesis polyprenyl glycosylphosphotransferase